VQDTPAAWLPPSQFNSSRCTARRAQNKNKKAATAQPESEDELDALCRQIEDAAGAGDATSSSAAAAKPTSSAVQRSLLLAADPKHLRAEVRWLLANSDAKAANRN
jgi:hypothetical protein